ncbi:MAG TPA: hypothetical protein VN761_11655 [Candidatus Polarisedimenticolia bacterium]|nr:hypothetical protein [Candidatus Polarisedimenticolia bacterium]
MNSTSVIADEVHAARHLCETGEWPELLDFACAWQKNSPEDYLAFFYIALAHSELGQYVQADTAYRRALALNDSDPIVWSNHAELLYHNLRQKTEGMSSMEHALKLNPDDKLNWLSLACMVGQLGHHQHAITFADRALALDSQFVEAYLRKGAAARALGKNELLREVCDALSAIPLEKFRGAR